MSETSTPVKETKRGMRYACFPDGDYVVMRRASQEADNMPDGTLVPFTGVAPQFKSTEEALKWIRENGGDIAVDGEGRPVKLPLAIVKFQRILDIEPELKPVVSVSERPRQQIIPEA